MADKNTSLQLNIPGNSLVFTDPFYLDIIVDNLLSNAVKYGKENGKLICSWNEANKTLSIADDGTGIDAVQLPLLFDRFFRADDSRSSAIAGSGLGLAIVKKLASLLHINIAVSSVPGNTVFSLQFAA